MSENAGSQLDRLLAEVSAKTIDPSPGLLARARADARGQARARGQAGISRGLRSRRVSRAGPWGALAAAIGGWPSLGGLAVVGLAGVWVGVGAPGSDAQALDDAAWGVGGAAEEIAEEITVGLGLDEDPLAAFDSGAEG